MNNNTLYIGVKGSVLALNKDTGKELWRRHLKGSSFVTLAIESDAIYAHTYGNLYCIDKVKGNIKWDDSLSGLGYGMAMIALKGSVSSNAQMQAAAIASTVTTLSNSGNQ
jgi:outer membrane protein assembly factor BamB